MLSRWKNTPLITFKVSLNSLTFSISRSRMLTPILEEFYWQHELNYHISLELRIALYFAEKIISISKIFTSLF